MAPSRHDWKIVDWDVKPQHNQPKMCLIRDFCMEKLLAREVTIFTGKNKSSKILLKIDKNNTKL